MAWAITAVSAAFVGTAYMQQDAARKQRNATKAAIAEQQAAEKAARDQMTNSANGRIALAASRKRAQQGLLSLGADGSTLGPGGQPSNRSLLSAGSYYSTQVAPPAGYVTGSSGGSLGMTAGGSPTMRIPTKPTISGSR